MLNENKEAYSSSKGIWYIRLGQTQNLPFATGSVMIIFFTKEFCISTTRIDKK
jgi:hypothetical protein